MDMESISTVLTAPTTATVNIDMIYLKSKIIYNCLTKGKKNGIISL
jgi:hypothetical protein